MSVTKSVVVVVDFQCTVRRRRTHVSDINQFMLTRVHLVPYVVAEDARDSRWNEILLLDVYRAIEYHGIELNYMCLVTSSGLVRVVAPYYFTVCSI